MESHLLGRSVLVLNKSWVAINTTSVRNAICLLYTESALVIQPQTFQAYNFWEWTEYSKQPEDETYYIRSCSFKILIPEVIVLLQYNKIPFTRVPFSRVNLYNRDQYQCQYCGIRPGINRLTIDHVIPRSKGGITSWENCVTACEKCNRAKGDRSLKISGLNLIQKPSEPQWTPLIHVRKKDILEHWSHFIKS